MGLTADRNAALRAQAAALEHVADALARIAQLLEPPRLFIPDDIPQPPAGDGPPPHT